LSECKAGTSELHVLQFTTVFKVQCQQRQSRRQTSMFTVCGASAERLFWSSLFSLFTQCRWKPASGYWSKEV